MSTSYGEPGMVPAENVTSYAQPLQPAPEVAPQAPAAPATTPASEPAAPSAPAAAVPPVGALAQYPVWDSYAQPPGNRVQNVLVTGHLTGPDGVLRVIGHVLGFADEVAHFLPEALTQLK